MPRISIQSKVAWLLALMTLSPTAIADIRSATGKPLLDFYTVYGAIDSVKIINELCNTRFPQYKKQNDRAYSLWQSRSKEFIYKVEQYNHAIVTKTSKGNEVSYRKQMLETAQKYEQNKVALHKMLSDYGETTYHDTCSAYREYTESEKADFPNYYKEHMQVFESYWRNFESLSSQSAAADSASRNGGSPLPQSTNPRRETEKDALTLIAESVTQEAKSLGRDQLWGSCIGPLLDRLHDGLNADRQVIGVSKLTERPTALGRVYVLLAKRNNPSSNSIFECELSAQREYIGGRVVR